MSAATASRRARTTPERTERRHELRPVDQREPLLRAQLQRLEPGPRAAPRRPGNELAVEPAPRPHRSAAARDARAARDRRWPRRSPGSAPAEEHLAVQALERAAPRPRRASLRQPVASAFARSTSAARTISSGYGSPTPQAWLRRSRTWSSSSQLGRDRLRDEPTEPGVDAVGALPERRRRARRPRGRRASVRAPTPTARPGRRPPRPPRRGRPRGRRR